MKSCVKRAVVLDTLLEDVTVTNSLIDNIHYRTSVPSANGWTFSVTLVRNKLDNKISIEISRVFRNMQNRKVLNQN